MAADAYDGTCNSHCSLRDAVSEANNNSGDDEIVIPAGLAPVINRGGIDDTNIAGDLDVWDSGTTPSTLTVRSDTAGTQVSVTSGVGDRLLHVLASGSTASVSVVLRDLHLKGGTLTGGTFGGGCMAHEGPGTLTLDHVRVEACQRQSAVTGVRGGGGIDSAGPLVVEGGSAFIQNLSWADGGAIYATDDVTLDDVLLRGNETRRAAGAVPEDGGALFVSGADVSVVDSTLEVNRARGSGGAIAVSQGTSDLTTSTLELNEALGSGGAIHVTNGSIRLDDVDLIDNLVELPASTLDAGGGAVFADHADVDAIQSVFRDNRVLAASGWGHGGALAVFDADVSLTAQSAVLENAVEGWGGGMYVRGGDALVDTTVFRLNLADFPSASGGGLRIDDGDLRVVDSEFEANRARGSGSPTGGAIHAGVPTASMPLIERSAIVYNVAEDTSGGSTASKGGGLFLVDRAGAASVVGLQNVTFSENGADYGGAIASDSGSVSAPNHDLDMAYATFYGNSASSGQVLHVDSSTSSTFTNTIIQNGPASISTADCTHTGSGLSGSSYSATNRTMTSTACILGSTGDTTTSVGLAGLGYAGGPTRLHQTPSTHPARDGGTCLVSVSDDQNGTSRPTSDCDMGSWEAP